MIHVTNKFFSSILFNFFLWLWYFAMQKFFFSEVMVFGLSVSTKINSSMLYLSTESTSSKFSNHLLNYAMMFLMILKKIFCFDGYFHQSILIVYLHFSLFFFWLSWLEVCLFCWLLNIKIFLFISSNFLKCIISWICLYQPFLNILLAYFVHFITFWAKYLINLFFMAINAPLISD